MSKRESRLVKLEAGNGAALSEPVRAWLGLRPPLTAEEEAAEQSPASVDLSNASPAMRDWLTRGVGNEGA